MGALSTHLGMPTFAGEQLVLWLVGACLMCLRTHAGFLSGTNINNMFGCSLNCCRYLHALQKLVNLWSPCKASIMPSNTHQIEQLKSGFNMTCSESHSGWRASGMGALSTRLGVLAFAILWLVGACLTCLRTRAGFCSGTNNHARALFSCC